MKTNSENKEMIDTIDYRQDVIEYLEEKKEFELLELYKKVVRDNDLFILSCNNNLDVKEIYQILNIINDL